MTKDLLFVNQYSGNGQPVRVCIPPNQAENKPAPHNDLPTWGSSSDPRAGRCGCTFAPRVHRRKNQVGNRSALHNARPHLLCLQDDIRTFEVRCRYNSPHPPYRRAKAQAHRTNAILCIVPNSSRYHSRALHRPGNKPPSPSDPHTHRSPRGNRHAHRLRMRFHESKRVPARNPSRPHSEIQQSLSLQTARIPRHGLRAHKRPRLHTLR